MNVVLFALLTTAAAAAADTTEPTAPPASDPTTAVTAVTEPADPAAAPPVVPAGDAGTEGSTKRLKDQDSSAAGDDVGQTPTSIGPASPRLGEPIPLSRRQLTLPAGAFEGSAHLGLVGTAGPTRFVNELRFAATDWLELRTAFLPIPSSLMARLRVFDTDGPAGSLVVDGGIAHADLTPLLGPLGNGERGLRANVEGGLTWSKTSGERMRAVLQVRLRSRLSTLKDDGQLTLAGAGHLDIDLRNDLGLTVGLGLASTLDTPVRETQVAFTEIDRPGMSWLLDKNSGDTLSLTVPVALVYGVTESFDVNVFMTPQVAPQLAVVVGAGLRIRWLP